MNQHTDAHARSVTPAAHFAEPHHVVHDPALSSDQKAHALDALEQDARQLAEATSEGMGGGEPSKLHDVLDAKDALLAATVTDAYGIVLLDLRLRQTLGPSPETGALIEKAIEALGKLATA
jgi:hypothetical protein